MIIPCYSTSRKVIYLLLLLFSIITGCGSKIEGNIFLEDFFNKSPSVTSTYPANLEKNVSIKTDVRINFDKDMDSKTITNTTFIIKDDKGNIDGVVSYSGRKAYFKPMVSLTANSNYTATLSREVKDSMGNNIPTDYSWSFTTDIPSIPTEVKAVSVGSKINISWGVVPEATYYNIYWSTTSDVTKSTGTKISGIASTTYAHTILTEGTTFYYVVTSVNDNGESVESAMVSATTQKLNHLPKTGQTNCYDTTGKVIACAGTGQDGELQKGVAWPDPRFTDNGDGTVTDNLTGLVWTKDGKTPGPAACSPGNTKTWQSALDYVSCLNNNTYLGYTDWQLPNVIELESLVNAGQANTATWLNTQGFNNVQSSSYWSSSSNAIFPNYAWYVRMWYGDMSYSNKSLVGYVWPVRSGQSGLLGYSVISLPKTGQTTCYDTTGKVISCAGTGQDGELQKGVAWPDPRFIDNGDNTITDDLTGLIWTKDGNTPGPATCTSATTKTWQSALNYVACLNSNSYLGYTDWRLPNVNEIESLINIGQSNTATWLNTQGFSNVQPGSYWSSTSFSNQLASAWVISMQYSYTYSYSKPLQYYVWPVRSDDTTPPSNPTSISGYSSSSKTTSFTSGNWYNYSAPYFEWSGASDSESGIAGYYVYFGTSSNADPATSGIYQTAVNYTVSSTLTSGSTYYLLIKAKDNAGHISLTTYTAFTYLYDSSPPSNTTDSNFINSGALSTDSTNVSMTISATDDTGVVGYYVSEIQTTPSPDILGWTSITSSTSYSDDITFSLSSGDGVKTVYVWFKDSAGNVSGSVSDSIILATPPPAPIGLTVLVGDGQATISWNAVSDATSYNLYWSTAPAITKTTGTKITGVSNPYTHTGLTNGTTYYYVVTAVNDNGESVESNQLLTIPPQVPISLPRTGQTTCYDSSGNVISCEGTGQDGELQKGVAWPDPRFTDNSDDTITDNLTGLMWTKDGNAPGPAACSPAVIKTWQEALDYVICLNSNSYIGYTDWRLPNVIEFESLKNAEQNNSATWLNTQGFNNVQSYYYWTSTSRSVTPDDARVVNIDVGHVGAGPKTEVLNVWPVRSVQSGLFENSLISLVKTGQNICYDTTGNVIACEGTGQDGDIKAGVAWPDPRFTDNGDGTITDNLTGLMWTKDGNAPGPATCSPATSKTWQAALNHVECLNTNSYLGYTDWRLPNVNELNSLLHAGINKSAGWLNLQGFINVQSSSYWSSTSIANNSNDAWIVYMFWEGQVGDGNKSYNSYVWPVRSGK